VTRPPLKTAELDAPPSWIEPSIPTLVSKPPRGADWRHEIKWDGYRICIVVNAGIAKVRTRRGLDWTDRLPSIATSAAKLACRNAILDGEAVALDGNGRSDFGLLQGDFAGAVAYVFDLLWLNGEDLRSQPLWERREALETLIGKGNGAILLSEEVAEDGVAFFNVACEHGLEGIVSKRVDRPYRSGKSGEWLKTKCVQTGNFVIVGYQPDERGRIANLKLALEENSELRYAGAVGTGWNESTILALKKRLDAIAVPEASIAGIKAKGAMWTAPTLRAEIAYRGLTATGELRAASFKRLREEE
jgi:bifunctional non-homologous end joining protein LigD